MEQGKLGKQNGITGLDNSACTFNNNIILSKTINVGAGKYILKYSFTITLTAHSFAMERQIGLQHQAQNWYFSTANPPQ